MVFVLVGLAYRWLNAGQRGKDEIKVVVRYPKSSRESLSNLDDLPLQSPDGREIPF